MNNEELKSSKPTSEGSQPSPPEVDNVQSSVTGFDETDKSRQQSLSTQPETRNLPLYSLLEEKPGVPGNETEKTSSEDETEIIIPEPLPFSTPCSKSLALVAVKTSEEKNGVSGSETEKTSSEDETEIIIPEPLPFSTPCSKSLALVTVKTSEEKNGVSGSETEKTSSEDENEIIIPSEPTPLSTLCSKSMALVAVKTDTDAQDSSPSSSAAKKGPVLEQGFLDPTDIYSLGHSAKLTDPFRTIVCDELGSAEKDPIYRRLNKFLKTSTIEISGSIEEIENEFSKMSTDLRDGPDATLIDKPQETGHHERESVLMIPDVTPITSESSSEPEPLQTESNLARSPEKDHGAIVGESSVSQELVERELADDRRKDHRSEEL